MPARTGGVLVIGGCGHVGHLVGPYMEAMYQEGELCVMEPNPCPSCPWDDRVIGDATNLGDLFLAVRGKDAILYLALGGPDARSLFEVGVYGWYNALLVAKEVHTPRLVLVSSLSVYDDWAMVALDREDRPPICDDPYGVVKVLAEDLGRHFARSYGMSVIALRLAVPVTEVERLRWLGKGKVPYATSDQQLARAFVAAVCLRDHTGFDAIHVCGHPDPNVVNQEKAKRLLGWEPQ